MSEGFQFVVCRVIWNNSLSFLARNDNNDSVYLTENLCDENVLKFKNGLDFLNLIRKYPYINSYLNSYGNPLYISKCDGKTLRGKLEIYKRISMVEIDNEYRFYYQDDGEYVTKLSDIDLDKCLYMNKFEKGIVLNHDSQKWVYFDKNEMLNPKIKISIDEFINRLILKLYSELQFLPIDNLRYNIDNINELLYEIKKINKIFE